MSKQNNTLSPEARRKRNTLVAGLIMAIPFCIAMYLIFGTSVNGEPEMINGLNGSVPAGIEEQMADTKQKAVEQQQKQDQQSERVRTVAESAFELIGGKQEDQSREDQSTPKDKINRSRETYRDVSRQVSSFYSEPKVNSEIEELKRQVAELSARLENGEQPKPDPVDMMERSYQLASKYLNSTPPSVPITPGKSPGAKEPTVWAHRVSEDVVSKLNQPLGDTAFIALVAQPRNYDFNTPVGSESCINHNSIRACIDDDQVVTPGSPVRLRLLEPMQVGTYVIPVNTVISGTAKIETQRLCIVITNIEYAGNVIPVELNAHDMDGQSGLSIPNSLEREAVKNAAANVGTGFGTSLSFAQSAGQQVAMDLVRGVMTGGSQYIASKIKQVKITLKANYQLLLISKK